MRYFLLICFSYLSSITDIAAQIFKPVKWNYKIEHVDGNTYNLIFTAQVQDGWTVYSQYTSEDGPVPTSVNYDESSGIEFLGKATESGSKKEGMDNYFGVNVIKFTADKPFVITQKIKVIDNSKPIIGYVNYMACDHERCLPPTDDEFTLTIPKLANKQSTSSTQKPVATTTSESGDDSTQEKPISEQESGPIDKTVPNQDTIVGASNTVSAILSGNTIDQKIQSLYDTYLNPIGQCGDVQEIREGYIWTFIFGFIGGMLALLTPCVFPMIPITVSFFTKDTKRKGWVNGLIYGLSIIVIYVTIGLLITRFVGPDALNRLSTNWIANTLFFLIFVAFALSFFGYYEITLPSSWSTGSDRLADQGGLLGIFFMAFTLALVSFSCTGPIIGTAIVQAATKGEYLSPFLVMLGFSLALALPFGVFAAFPAWLNSLPKSGSWMNSVKVVLGFLELALAFKFLSVADLTNGWGIFRYEAFMAIWIVIFIGMALYLFGLIKFPHDSPIKKLSIIRLGLGVGTVALVFYLISGFTINKKTGEYNALLLMSGLAPPARYNFFLDTEKVDPILKAKYSSYSKCANNINCFKDYFEGMQYAKDVNKPALIDFTGHGCVNCRKTEEHIWVDERIRSILNDSVVLISLYVDDDKKIENILNSIHTGKKLRNVGNKWTDFQIVNFEQNSQPLYVFVSNEQNVLSRPRPYVDDIQGYFEFLKCGLSINKN